MNKSFLDKKIEKTVKDTIKEYKQFAFKEDIKKVCFAVILASSFDNLIKIISNNLFMPFFDFIINKTNGEWRNYTLEVVPGLELGLGKILGGVIDFTIISFLLFVLLKKVFINKEQK
jgi:large-conductance mechanosensitive channel